MPYFLPTPFNRMQPSPSPSTSPVGFEIQPEHQEDRNQVILYKDLCLKQEITHTHTHKNTFTACVW